MKKALFLLIFAVLAVFSIVAEMPNRLIFIEGTASRPDHRQFFLSNFEIEAIGLGHATTTNRHEAGYILRFNVGPNMIEFDDGTSMQAPPDEKQFVIQISFICNTENNELVTFGFHFTDLDEMFEFNQLLFQRAAVNIPALTEGDFAHSGGGTLVDDSWRNKRIYLRFSVDYPVTIYELQGTGLYENVSAYLGDDIDDPENIVPLNHRFSMLPGITAGIEFHLFRPLCIGLSFQLFLGDTFDNMFMNMAAGAELKIPLRLGNFMIQPYGAFSYFLNVSPHFVEDEDGVFPGASFPDFAFGGGIQFAGRGGRNGAFFVDIKYLISLDNAVMHNYLILADKEDQLAPNPPVIHYKRSFIGIGIGYKFGLFTRR
jgi:hypothetical protein